ncbi:MAG TPA: SRPBCC domain-containing protein, partial [Gemmatimonadaceae bacterium]
WPHREIAQYVHDKYKVPGWWAQNVTVGYERIRGLREKGQRRSGSWEAAKSKTIAAAVGTIFKSFKQPKLRSKWLTGGTAVVRTSVPNKSLRLTWEDGSSVEVYLVAKGRSKTLVAIQHTRLPNRDTANRMKAFWAEHLEALATHLASKKE